MPSRNFDELSKLLAPPGGGIHVVSTGASTQLALQERLAGVAGTEAVRKRFVENLRKIPTARGVLLGIPSDVGAGFRRGSAYGPSAIRLQLREDAFALEAFGVVDIGDVRCVPQLLHDEMLSEAQVLATRTALYGGEALPVSPLSIAERVWELVLERNPKAVLFTLGGDHSTALPVVRALAKKRSDLAVVQVDAHTDLLAERLGVKYCFGTWSWHANDLLGRGGRMIQVGIRASAHAREHWEQSLNVRQFWADAVREAPRESLEEIARYVRELGVDGLIFSNDIDGTDQAWADATGTPEPDGLDPDWVIALIRRLGRECPILGADVMEVAPPLGTSPLRAHRTVALAARYFAESVASALPAQP